MEKTSWYKPDLKRKADDAASKFQYNPPGKKRKHQGGNKHHEGPQGGQGQGQSQKSKIKGVMFIPYTKHSELASRLRDNEQKMEQLTGYRIKIVERGGKKLVDILHKANPWAGQDCGREGCLLCKTKREEGLTNSQDCKKRNCVYETICLTCRDRQDRDIEERMERKDQRRLKMKRGRHADISI